MYECLYEFLYECLYEFHYEFLCGFLDDFLYVLFMNFTNYFIHECPYAFTYIKVYICINLYENLKMNFCEDS